MTIETMGTEGAVEDTSANQAEAPLASAVEEGETPEAEEGGEEGEYTPDYGFKFYGKKGEMEEWARQFIRDKETEDRFRSLYAKSHGYDHLRELSKARDGAFQTVQQQYQEAQATLKERSDVLEELQHRRDTDLASFFEYANVPIEKVIDFVEEHLKFLQKPESEQQKIAEYRQHAARARELEKENQTFKERLEAEETESHVASFNELCEHPEVAGFADRYDSVVGKVGAFREAVINHGDAEFQRTGNTLAPLEAIRAVYRQYKPFVLREERQAAVESGETPETPRQAASSGQRRPTIPNMGGSASRSPAKRVFTSVEELQAHHKQLVANQGD